MEKEPESPQMENRKNIEVLLGQLPAMKGNAYDPNNQSQEVLTDLNKALAEESDQEYVASIRTRIEEIMEK